MEKFRVKQDLSFVLVPLIFSLLVFVGALFMSSFWKWGFILLSLVFAGVVLWQSRPFFKNFELVITPKEIYVNDFRGKTVRQLKWGKVEAVATGYRKNWLIYTYSFYFKVKGEEDLLFALITRTPNLAGKFQKFVKVFVRKKIPVQLVKA